MHALVSHPLIQHARAGQWRGEFMAVSLFVDISGFTALTETLMQHQKAGAEVLTEALNTIFHPLVQVVYAHDGFIATFAGDAFTALFPITTTPTDTVLHATRVAFIVQQFFVTHAHLPTVYGTFALGVKVGIGMGPVTWGIIASGQRLDTPTALATGFFRGAGVDACVQAEHHAKSGDIIADAACAALLPPAVERTPLETHARLTALRLPDPPARHPAAPPLADATMPAAILQRFVPAAVRDLLASGARAEFRQVTIAFLSFAEPPDDAALDDFIATVLTLTTDYGGYFNKLDFGDKGGVMLLLFGAPIAHENDSTRAADMLLALALLTQSSGIAWRAGLTSGIVYAGLIGSIERCEYTAIGDVVNLAARLMMNAPWGDCWLSAAVAAQLEPQGYRLHPLGRFQFKGKQQAVAVWRLDGKVQHTHTPVVWSTMVGRETALTRLAQAIEPVFQRRWAGVVTIGGEAGVGKSRLVTELQQRLCERLTMRWLVCPTDDILRQSLNPLVAMLRSSFAQSDQHPKAENQQRFDTILDQLLADCQQHEAHEHDDTTPVSLASELQRTRSFLAALLGFHQPGSLYDQLDPRRRFENTLQALTTLLLAESTRQPVVLFLEDLHWLDSDTHTWLQAATRVFHAASARIAIVATSRPGDDGRPVSLALDAAIPQQTIMLHGLDLEGVQALASDYLGAPLSADLAPLVQAKTSGNPFFVEQLLLDLHERHAFTLTAEGHYGTDPQALATLPASVTAVLVARLDRLPLALKHLVQTAAVLGRTFALPVLEAMLPDTPALLQHVQHIESVHIWVEDKAGRYQFHHALLCDAAYDMQLRARLRTLHAQAGTAIEQVYASDLAPHYADLAYHYRHAALPDQERICAALAGEWSATHFANAEAVTHLSRALEVTPLEEHVARSALLQTRELVYDREGNRPAQAADLATLTVLLQVEEDPQRQAEVALRHANYAIVTGDYPAASDAAHQAIHLGAAGDAPELHARGYLALGRVLVKEGAYQEAQGWLEQAHTLAQCANAPHTEAECLLLRSSVAYYQGDYPTAHAFDTQAFHLFEHLEDAPGQASALDALACTLTEQGEYAQARTCYEQALERYRTIGDQWGMGATLVNLGQLHREVGNYGAASTCCQQGLRICEAIGDREGVASTLGALGWIALNQGDYAQAEAHYQSALLMYHDLGVRDQVAWIHASQGLLAYLRGEPARAYACTQQVLAGTGEGEEDESNPSILGDAWTVQGHALRALARWEEAATAYAEALTLWEALEKPNRAQEAQAGLAALALAQGKVERAVELVAPILHYLETGDLTGADDPFRVYLTCFQVLEASGDERAPALLHRACQHLQAQAATIPDPAQRQRFLAIATHRALLAALQAAG
jgi:class 3 adenylate cyclase/tetratricopeptide (TPR) repeat protein